MQDFKKLAVWEKSHRLTLNVYRETNNFPRLEMFSLTTQMRRSASSMPMNMAEGCGRGSNADMARFLQMAMGSACELEYQLILARDMGYLDTSTYTPLDTDLTEAKRMLASLIARVRATNND